MDKDTEVKHVSKAGLPYYNPCEERTFTTGGHEFHIWLYEGYNAMGLIGTEFNGIAMASVTDRNMVFDGWLRKGMGFDYRAEKLAELLRIVALDAQELSEFLDGMNAHGRHCRYNPLTAVKKARARTARRNKIDAGIAKKKAGDYTGEEFMDAKLKARVARDYELFLIARMDMDDGEAKETEYGARFRPFTEALYKHHSLHMGYIAHNNIAGFFEAQYRDPEDFLRNVRRFANGVSGMGFSLLHNRYHDLNSVIQKVARHYLPLIEARLPQPSLPLGDTRRLQPA